MTEKLNASLSAEMGEANGAETPSPRQPSGNGPQASDQQLEYARHLAGQLRGAAVRKLVLLAQRSEKPLVDMTSAEADDLINTLKALRDGLPI